MAFLLRLRNRGFDRVTPVDDLDKAIEQARAFVGEHNPIDGCSTRPEVVSFTSGRWSMTRSSSFGTYRANIYPMEGNVEGSPVWDII